MKDLPPEVIRESVRKRYGELAQQGRSGCGCAPSGLLFRAAPALTGPCLLADRVFPGRVASLPEGADLGLGCGNPQAIAALKPGRRVLDLGSGGGFDCFLAARQVGESGRVIGVDMTAEMVAKARENAGEAGYVNVEFRLGEIEHLPVADASVDVIISNCVINLSPDKGQVFREAFRVLRPGGRLAISDVVATAPMPDEIRKDLALYAGCLAGAAAIDHLEAMLHAGRVPPDPHSDQRGEPPVHSQLGAGEKDRRLPRLGQHRSGETGILVVVLAIREFPWQRAEGLSAILVCHGC